jgi:uncharacterized protein YcaQ
MTVTPISLAQLRALAARPSLFDTPTAQAAVERLGFVQADPIQAPARAQDLILRQRVAGYRAGDLEEDVLHVYGFMPAATLDLLHPRAGRYASSATTTPSRTNCWRSSARTATPATAIWKRCWATRARAATGATRPG